MRKKRSISLLLFFLDARRGPDGNYPQVITAEERLHFQNRLESLMRSTSFPPHTPQYLATLEQTAEYCFHWISNDVHGTAGQSTSISALLSSQHLAAHLSEHLSPSMVITFRHFLLSTTLARVGWQDRRPTPERLSLSALHHLSFATGSALLQQLDQCMTPPGTDVTATPPSRATSQAHFVLKLGVALGVAYSTARQPIARPPLSAIQTDPVLGGSPTSWLMARERLRGLLGRELVSLAGLLWPGMVSPAVQESLEGIASGRWAPQHERWTWGGEMTPRGDSVLSDAVTEPGDRQGPDAGGGMLGPEPRVYMVDQPEVLHPGLPGPDVSDKQKQRSMLVVGPFEDRQICARMRICDGSGAIKMMV